MSVKLAWAIAALGSFIALLYSMMRYRMFWLAVGAIWLGTVYFGPQDFKEWLKKPPPPPTVVEKVVYVPQALKADPEEIKRVERDKTLSVAAGIIINAKNLDKIRVGGLTNEACQSFGQIFTSKVDAHTKLVDAGLTVYQNDFQYLIDAGETWMKSYSRLCKDSNGTTIARKAPAPKPVRVAPTPTVVAPTPAVAAETSVYEEKLKAARDSVSVVYEAKPIDEYAQARCKQLIKNRDDFLRGGLVTYADAAYANYLKTCK